MILKKKIIWVEESFYKPQLSPTEVIMLKRRAMLAAMPVSDWYIQMDADEYFVDFVSFRTFLEQIKGEHQDTVVTCSFKTMFKKVDDGYLMIKGNLEEITMAFNTPKITTERNLSNAKKIVSNCQVLHHSWARSEDEIRQKVLNWSHSKDFDTKSFYKFWTQLNANNFKYERNFHPLYGPTWPAIEYVHASDEIELLDFYKAYPARIDSVCPLPIWLRVYRKVRRLLVLK